jgi:biopolymer transport protein ExbB/TolQ
MHEQTEGASILRVPQFLNTNTRGATCESVSMRCVIPDRAERRFSRAHPFRPFRHATAIDPHSRRRGSALSPWLKNRYNRLPMQVDTFWGPSFSRAMVMSNDRASKDLVCTPGRRGITLPALLFGVPLAAGILALFTPGYGPFAHLEISRYFQHHVERVEVLLFCCALCALAAKFWRHLGEGRIDGAKLLPAWDGKPVPISTASTLVGTVSRASRRLRDSLLGKRVVSALDFVRQRGSADGFDDHLRALTDNDALALETSYALVRFLTWAMPILGFLGTVLGITASIAGITPEKLENDLSSVTDGLALAFDATALALSMTMLTMFFSFLVERAEQSSLDAIDRFVDHELAHRFERVEGDSNPLLEAARRNTDTLIEATRTVVKQQANLWAQTLAETDIRRAAGEEKKLDKIAAALEAAMETTLDAHTERLQAAERQSIDRGAAILKQTEHLAHAMRDQQSVLARMADGILDQTRVLAQLQNGGNQLVGLQDSLDRNLTALAGCGSFDQAIQSLTAAIHLLTARANEVSQVAKAGAMAKRPGAAA